jgi:hypothetical protein
VNFDLDEFECLVMEYGARVFVEKGYCISIVAMHKTVYSAFYNDSRPTSITYHPTSQPDTDFMIMRKGLPLGIIIMFHPSLQNLLVNPYIVKFYWDEGISSVADLRDIR